MDAECFHMAVLARRRSYPSARPSPRPLQAERRVFAHLTSSHGSGCHDTAQGSRLVMLEDIQLARHPEDIEMIKKQIDVCAGQPIVRKERPSKCIPEDARQHPTLQGLARTECNVENSTSVFSSAAVRHNKHHVDTFSAVLQAGVSPTGTFFLLREPPCAHMSSWATEGGQGRMWDMVASLWLAPVGSPYSRSPKFQTIQCFIFSEASGISFLDGLTS